RCQRVMEPCHHTDPAPVAAGGAMARCLLLAGEHADPSWPPPKEIITVDAAGAQANANSTPTRPAGEPLLEVSGLNVRFRTMSPLKAKLGKVDDPFVDAVLDASVSVRPGETVGL